jgi:chorismate dehydratase
VTSHDPNLAPRPRPLRVSAIDFLNPAPLMWDLEHPPLAAELGRRYTVHYTRPSQCAADLLSGDADFGLVPIAALTPELAIVPGCTIASLDRVRSIQLIVRGDRALNDVRSVAADTASRSSVAYAEVLFRKFLGVSPSFLPCPADPVAMLRCADAAVLIGDPALLALEGRDVLEAQLGPCQWFDLAHEWHTRTGLPWVAAVWAARPGAIADASHLRTNQTIDDLNQSRIHGLEHIDDLVTEWTPRIAIPPATVRAYLSHNIHYTLDDACTEALHVFRRYAAEIGALPPLTQPVFL